MKANVKRKHHRGQQVDWVWVFGR